MLDLQKNFSAMCCTGIGLLRHIPVCLYLAFLNLLLCSSCNPTTPDINLYTSALLNKLSIRRFNFQSNSTMHCKTKTLKPFKLKNPLIYIARFTMLEFSNQTTYLSYLRSWFLNDVPDMIGKFRWYCTYLQFFNEQKQHYKPRSPGSSGRYSQVCFVDHIILCLICLASQWLPRLWTF